MDLKLLSSEHPSFSPERCINRRQRRVVCTRCTDVCPRRVFSLKDGDRLQWDHCTDCGLCTANCPSRCFTLSRGMYEEFTGVNLNRPVVVACRKEEKQADIRLRCLAAVPWELLALYALKTDIVLYTGACETCGEAVWKNCLQKNLEALEQFLGETYSKRVRVLKYEIYRPETPQEDRELSRRALFSGLKKAAAKTAVQEAAKRFPFPEISEEGMRWRELLAGAVGQKNREETAQRYGTDLPRYTVNCDGCGICEKICPQKAIRLSTEENGARMIYITPWKCTGCSLCEKLCFKKGIAGIYPVQVPRMTELPLVRVKVKGKQEGT